MKEEHEINITKTAQESEAIIKPRDIVNELSGDFFIGMMEQSQQVFFIAKVTN